MREIAAVASHVRQQAMPTGQARARAALGERATIAYLPFDLAGPIRRFLARYDPRGLVLVEGEFWPLLLETLSRQEIPVVLVNGRISERNTQKTTKAMAAATKPARR